MRRTAARRKEVLMRDQGNAPVGRSGDRSVAPDKSVQDLRCRQGTLTVCWTSARDTTMEVGTPPFCGPRERRQPGCV